MTEPARLPSRRIVLVLAAPPLPFGNAAARWYSVLLRTLVERGHRVTALIPCVEENQAGEVHALFPKPDYDIRCFSHWQRKGIRAKWESFRRPSSYVFNDDLRACMRTLMADPQAILHLEHNWAGWLSRGYEDRAVLAVHFLVADDLPLRTWYAIVARAAERRLLHDHRIMTTVTPTLAKHVRTMAPAAHVTTIPLAFDTSLYDMPGALPVRPQPVVGLIGSFGWHPTTVAARRLLDVLWPQIAARVPHAKLLIVGRDAHRVLRAHLNQSDVEILDNVADIAPHFHALDVLLYAPPRGSGMKVKVMEAFAFGTPVVTTSAGAEGIPIQDGTHAGVSDDDDGLVERTIALLEDPAKQDRYRHAARELIERHCAPHLAVDRFEAVYAQCG